MREGAAEGRGELGRALQGLGRGLGVPPAPRSGSSWCTQSRKQGQGLQASPAQSLPPNGPAAPPGQLPGVPAVSYPEHLCRGRRQQTLRVARAQPPGREAGC